MLTAREARVRPHALHLWIRAHARIWARATRIAAAALTAALALGAASPAAAAANPYRDVTRVLGQGLLSLFPAVEGFVISAGDGDAYVDLARKDLLRPGMELQIYRPGGEMTHPVTRLVIGTYEKDLGVLRVTEVRDKYSRGRLDTAGATAGVVPGDRVRISARRLRTLLHFSGAAPGIEVGPLAQEFQARGVESERFAMLDEPVWASSLAGAPWDAVRADPAALRRLGEAAAADLLLAVRIEAGVAPGLVVEVISLKTGDLLDVLSERWPAPQAALPPPTSAQAGAEAPASPVAADPSVPASAAAPPPVPAAAVQSVPAPVPPLAPTPRQYAEYTERDLAAPALALAAGDILGEGRIDVLLSDGGQLSLYRWEEQALSWRWDEQPRGGRHILALDAADVDGDGRFEVIVAQAARGRVATEVRRWREGGLQTVATVDGVYLRAMPRPGMAALLLGQRAGYGEVLAGRVEQYELRDGSIVRVDGTSLPRGVGIFGLALAPPGGSVALYALDRAGYLSGFTPTGGVLWHSTRAYGGYPPPVTARELFGQAFTDDESFEEEAKAFQGRLFVENAPSGIRLTVARNYGDGPVVLVRQRSIGKGEVVVLEGSPRSPEEVFRSRSFDGYVADMARADMDDDGSVEILFAVNRFAGPLLGDRGKLVLWRPDARTGGDK